MYYYLSTPTHLPVYPPPQVRLFFSEVSDKWVASGQYPVRVEDVVDEVFDMVREIRCVTVEDSRDTMDARREVGKLLTVSRSFFRLPSVCR